MWRSGLSDVPLGPESQYKSLSPALSRAPLVSMMNRGLASWMKCVRSEYSELWQDRLVPVTAARGRR